MLDCHCCEGGTCPYIHQPSPMLVLAGASNAGKTLFIINCEECIRGWSANPMTTWTGQLPWSDDLLSSELLLIGDPVSSTDSRDGKHSEARFKEAIYAGDVAINTRRRSSVTMRPHKGGVMLVPMAQSGVNSSAAAKGIDG